MAQTRIPGVTATTDMGSGYGTSLLNTLNGVGLSSTTLTATHSPTTPGNSWVSQAPTLTGQVTFALDGTYSVDGFSFWNQNAGGPGGSGATGIKGVSVQYSVGGVSFSAIPGAPTQFAQVPATDAGPEIVSFAPVTATHIRFVVSSNWGDPNQTGFAEVGFAGVPAALVGTTTRSVSFDIYNQGRGGSLPSRVRAFVSDHAGLESHELGTGKDVEVEVSRISAATTGCGDPAPADCTPALLSGDSASYEATIESPSGGLGRHVATGGAVENEGGTFTLTSSPSTSSTVSFHYGRHLWIEADAARDGEGAKLDEAAQELAVLQSNDAQRVFVSEAAPQFGDLVLLKATYETLSGGSISGSPRLEIHLEGHGKIVIRLGSSPSFIDADASSGVNMIGNNDPGRYDTTGLTGVDESAQQESTTYETALGAAGAFVVSHIDFVTDDASGPTRTYTLMGIETGTP